MNHFPVIKDLVTDMEPFFRKFRDTLSFFEPKDDSPEPAVIPPDAPEREEIRIATDCIACGCCVSSCTMVDHHPDYAGPAALARAYSLMADTRDALLGPRLAAALASCHDCRTEANCTEVCPKGISPTRAIKYIQRLAITADIDQPEEALEPEKLPTNEPSRWKQIDRATFLRGAGVALLGTGVAAAMGGIAAVTTIGAGAKGPPQQWIPLAKLGDLPAGAVTSVLMKYDVTSGIYSQPVSTTVLVSRLDDQIVCYKSGCPHLGCTVRWDGSSDQYRCACHGGTFDRNANVVAGPPPRPLDQYMHKVESDQLFVLV